MNHIDGNKLFLNMYNSNKNIRKNNKYCEKNIYFA